MAKKRKTRSQKIRSKERSIAKSGIEKKRSADPRKVESDPKVITEASVTPKSDLSRSLRIVLLLIVVQIFLWLLLRITHIDNVIYSWIKI